jgi:hypothetical protein
MNEREGKLCLGAYHVAAQNLGVRGKKDLNGAV